MIEGTKAQNYHDGNKLELMVDRRATKDDIKRAFEHIYETRVSRVNTRITRKGKYAIVTLVEKGKADEIVTKSGIF